MNTTKLKIWLPLLIALSMIVGMAIGYKLKKDTTTNTFLKNTSPSSLNEITRIIQKNYVDDIDINYVRNKAVSSFLKELDPYSAYLTPMEAQVFSEEMQGTFKGIGIDYEKIDDTINIFSMTSKGPAEIAGMKVGDHLIKLNGMDVTYNNQPGFDFRKTLREQIRKSNELSFTVARNHKILEIPVIAAIVPLPSIEVAYKIDTSIALIKLSKFSETSYKEFMQHTETLAAQGMQSLIIDLRGNTGGIMEQAYQIASEFFPVNRLIFSTSDKAGKKDYKSLRDGIHKDLPLAVLVDEATASSAEIFAAVMQDYGRAPIIGRQTYGKALVQNLFRLSDGGAVRISVARYFTPLGRNIQKQFGNVDDSSQQKKEFVNKAGQKLYSHDAIRPDRFVAFDTLHFPEQVRNFYVNGSLNQFVYKYYIANAESLHRYTSPHDFCKRFQTSDNDWKNIEMYALNKGYDISSLAPVARQELLDMFKAFLGRQLWRNEGYFIISNYTNATVKAAVAELKK